MRATWRAFAQFVGGFVAYCLVAPWVVLVGNSGRWLSVAAVPIAVLMGLVFLAFVVDAQRRGWTAFTLGVLTGITVTVVALATLLVLFDRGMRSFSRS